MIITIQDSKCQASIDSLEAQLISLKDCSGQEYIWQRDPEYWPRCSPTLFPIVGNLRNDQTQIAGKWYQIPKHGFCKGTEFAVVHQDDTSASFQITDTDKTRVMYPYSFVLTLTYRIVDGTLTITYQVQNTDNQTIHYCIGAHPGFCCPMEPDAVLEDYVLKFEAKENSTSMRYDAKLLQFDPAAKGISLQNEDEIPLSRELFHDDAVYFDQINSRQVSILNKKTGKGVTVSYPDFETIAFWSPYPANAPFVCIEPWNGSAVYATENDEFLNKNHLQHLAFGECQEYHLSICIL